MKRYLTAALAATVLALGSLAGSASAWAANVSFTGSLEADNDVKLFSFTLAADGDIAVRTWSYAGGINAAGALIGAGGFDAVVSLFFGSGNDALLIGTNDDGLGVAIDPATGEAHDALLEFGGLSAGTYTVSLSQFANLANGPTLGDGFLGAGATGFDGRSSAWALDILSVDSAAQIPVPTTLALALFGLAAVGTRRTAARRS